MGLFSFVFVRRRNHFAVDPTLGQRTSWNRYRAGQYCRAMSQSRKSLMCDFIQTKISPIVLFVDPQNVRKYTENRMHVVNRSGGVRWHGTAREPTQKNPKPKPKKDFRRKERKRDRFSFVFFHFPFAFGQTRFNYCILLLFEFYRNCTKKGRITA